ncbi:hypothetical protein K438DRAFT_1771490 [Mycena galopus ATCC 62051]|nr:hypothetical protein K438DRAFT_1771490 [Mycena galopus ATCC 62051]
MDSGGRPTRRPCRDHNRIFYAKSLDAGSEWAGYLIRSSPLNRYLKSAPPPFFFLSKYRCMASWISILREGKGEDTSATEQQVTVAACPVSAGTWERVRHMRYLSLLYNTDAVNAENHANTVRDFMADPGLFFQPVVFDERSIQMICAHFGSLESFDEETNGPAKHTCYPLPHNGPRLVEMDAGCWEVKWNHRDDAIQNFAPPTRPKNDSLTSSPGTIQSQGFAALDLVLHGDASADISFSVSSTSTDDWTWITVPSLPTQCYDSSASFRSPGFCDKSPTDTKVEWTDIDFPPLGETKADRRAEQVWPTRASKGGDNERPLSSLSVVIGDADGAASHHDPNAIMYQDEEQDLDIPDTLGLGMSPITPKTAGSQFPSTPTSTNGDSFQDKSVTGRSAFAFVKFNNTESPARAVFKEVVQFIPPLNILAPYDACSLPKIHLYMRFLCLAVRPIPHWYIADTATGQQRLVDGGNEANVQEPVTDILHQCLTVTQNVQRRQESAFPTPQLGNKNLLTWTMRGTLVSTHISAIPDHRVHS